MITITRKLEFDAAHRVMNHESKCANLHGHRYVVEVTATAHELDPIGRVIDFSVIKAKIGGWIDHHWDHNTLVNEDDEELLSALEAITQPKVPFEMPDNPTAELMAQYLLLEVCPFQLKDTGVKVIGIRIWETPNCYADATLDKLVLERGVPQ